MRLSCFSRCFPYHFSSMLSTALNYDLFSTVTFLSLQDDGWEMTVGWLCGYEDDVVNDILVLQDESSSFEEP